MYSSTLKSDQPFSFFNWPVDIQEMELPGHILPAESGIVPGVFKAFAIENNIHLLCGAYNPEEDFLLHKMPLTHEFFILRIDDISHARSALLIADNKYNGGMYAKNQSVVLMSSLEEFSFFASKDAQVKTLEIIIPRRWFFSQLGIKCPYGLFKKYMAIKSRKTQIDGNNHLFRNLFLEIISEAGKETSDIDYLKNNVTSLLTIFFTNLSSNLNNFQESEKVKISKEEINRLMTVRKHLDFSVPPPTFTSLTKIALMSGTSLKTKFKKMYGATIFEYYQRMRMQRARILLLTHKYSVKQIGCELGYSNMSNFTIAFKKEFDQLPHELTK